MRDKVIFYRNKVCVLRICDRDVLYQEQDPKIGGHFASEKTLSRLQHYQWKAKTNDFYRYCQNCLACQEQKDYLNQKNFTDPTPLDITTRTWGSLATNFIVKFPKTKHSFDNTTTWVDRISCSALQDNLYTCTLHTLEGRRHGCRCSRSCSCKILQA